MNKSLAKLAELACCASLSMNIYAHSGHGYRILSEGIEGNAENFRYIEGGKNGVSYKQLTAETKNTTGKINQPVMVMGYHSVHIKNIDVKKHKQTYRFLIDCLGQQNFFMRTVEIEGGGDFSDDGATELTVKSDKPGIYTIRVMTTLSGSESGTGLGSARLTITK